jgi:hypothetical protein
MVAATALVQSRARKVTVQGRTRAEHVANHFGPHLLHTFNLYPGRSATGHKGMLGKVAVPLSKIEPGATTVKFLTFPKTAKTGPKLRVTLKLVALSQSQLSVSAALLFFQQTKKCSLSI